MAVTSIWPIKGSVTSVINYARDPEKTNEKYPEKTTVIHAIGGVLEYAANEIKTERSLYVTGVNCSEKNTANDFNFTRTRWNSKGTRVCYHGYQSFAEGEVDAETAHEIGVELARRVWGDRFEVLVATHCNTGHYHNHFVINAVSFRDGRKFDNNGEDYRRMREESDRLCLEYGLSVIENPRDKGMNYAELKAEQEGVPTLRSSIRSAIDLAVKCSVTKKQFLSHMNEMGFIIDESGKHAKIKHIGTERFVRFRSLGEGYSVEEIIERIKNNRDPASLELPNQDDMRKVFEGESEPVRIMSYIPLFRSYNRALNIAKERPYQNFRIYYLVRQDFSAKQLYEDSLDLLVDHNLKTGQDVVNYKEEAMRQIDENLRLRNEMRNLLKRAERAGNLIEADKARYNIGVYSMRLSKLRREVTTCDEVLERSRHVRDNLTRIEQGKLKGKDGVVNEHVIRRGGTGRENEPQRS